MEGRRDGGKEGRRDGGKKGWREEGMEGLVKTGSSSYILSSIFFLTLHFFPTCTHSSSEDVYCRVEGGKERRIGEGGGGKGGER